jgi:hypothetical protein
MRLRGYHRKLPAAAQAYLKGIQMILCGLDAL